VAGGPAPINDPGPRRCMPSIRLHPGGKPELLAHSGEEDETGDMALFALHLGAETPAAQGFGLVIKDNDYKQTLWFHYLAWGEIFNSDRALNLLGSFVESLAAGADTRPADEAESRAERIKGNVEGFVFVLEFALAAPLSLEEELVLTEVLQAVFKELPDEELTGFDDYPLYRQLIMALEEQAQVAEVQAILADVVWGWVEESEADDPVINLLRGPLLEADSILIAGRTPLTDVAALSSA